MSVKALFGRIEIDSFLVFSVVCWCCQSRLSTRVHEEIIAHRWGVARLICSGLEGHEAADVGGAQISSAYYGLVSFSCLFWVGSGRYFMDLF